MVKCFCIFHHCQEAGYCKQRCNGIRLNEKRNNCRKMSETEIWETMYESRHLGKRTELNAKVLRGSSSFSPVHLRLEYIKNKGIVF